MNPRLKPTVPEVLPMVYAYRDTEGNGAGGSLHSVFDDGNLEDRHIKGCIECAKGRGDAAGVELGETLLRMSRTQRRKLSARFYSLDAVPAQKT
jgi:hypothetical protein